jgi:hypothetical protein
LVSANEALLKSAVTGNNRVRTRNSLLMFFIAFLFGARQQPRSFRGYASGGTATLIQVKSADYDVRSGSEADIQLGE